MSETFLQTFFAYFSACAGALLAATVKISHKQLCALISFAAGTLLAVTVFHIVPEAWSALSPIPVLIALISGYLLFFLISRYVFHVCPACAASHFEEQTSSHLKKFILLLVIALSIHSGMDGLAIAIGGHPDSTGHSLFLTVMIHKLPEGLALCALLIKAGYQRIRAFVLAILFEASTLAGWALGVYFARNGLELGWANLILVHIGGGFVYLALHAVFNESKEHSPRFVILFFLLGVILIGLTH